MRIAILTAGSRGDVQPYVALGRGLSDAGFTVRVATHAGFRQLVEAQGLEYAHVVQPSDVLTADPRWQDLQGAGDTAGRFVRRCARVVKIAQPLLLGMLDDFWAACERSDAVIGSIAAFGSPQLAAALGVPHCWGLFQPMTPTTDYAHFMAPEVPPRLNFRTHVIAEHVHWRLFRRPLERWLATNLGVRAPRRPGPGGLFGSGGGAIVYGMSPTLVPRPRDYPGNVAQFGSWFLDAAPESALQPELEEFLDSGPAPLFVHVDRIAMTPRERLLELVVRSLGRLGLRGLVSGATRIEPLSESVLAVPAVPFDRLLPRVAAVVHHGGAGTTATALRARRPSLGLPGFFDQLFWSKRIASLGAGPPPVAARRLTEARLEAALARLVDDRTFAERAATVGRRIARERGVDETVAHVSALLLSPGGAMRRA